MTISTSSGASPKTPIAWLGPLVALVGLALLCPGLTSARTWNIYEDGSGDVHSIQRAMTKAAPGDTILVWPGTYPDSIAMSSGVSLVSQAGPTETILDAAGALVAIDGARAAPVSGVLVQGFTITGTRNGGFTDVARTIDVDGDLIVRDCIITGNFAVVAGAHLRQGDLRILDTVFVDNFGGGFQGEWVAGVSCRDGYILVQGCTFDALTYGLTLRVEGGWVEFRGNVVRDCDRTIEVLAGATYVLFESNLFDRVPFPLTVTGGPPVFIRRNTFARAGAGVAALGPGIGAITVVDSNVFTGAYWGLSICCPGITVTCNDSFDNEVNWDGRGDLDGVDGNFSMDPRFCDPSGGDFTVYDDSPLLPRHSPCGQPVGAFGIGCQASPVEATSWGVIKGRFR